MLEYFLGAIVLLAAYLVFRCVIIPRRQISNYVKLFRSHGYNVIQLPYRPFGAPFYDQILESKEKNKDPFYTYKHVYHGVDLLVGNILTKPEIVIMNSELLMEIMGPEKVMILPKEKNLAEVFFSLVKKGLIAVEGNEWKHRRKMISKVFTHEFIASQIPLMCTILNQVFDEFEEESLKEHPEGKQKNEYEVDLMKMMTKFTSSAVISGFLGTESLKEQIKGESISDCMQKMVSISFISLNDPLYLLFGEKILNRRWRKIDRHILDLKNQTNAILKSFIKGFEEKIKEGKEERTQKSIVQLLIEERNKSGENSQNAISDEDLADQIKTFTVAADTTSSYITAMVLFVFQNPRIVQKLRNEVESAIQSDEDITVDKLAKLSYLECIISQTSRYIPPPGLLQRELAEDSTLNKVPLKKGLLIDSCFVRLLHDPETFENPSEFIPERWQKEDSKKNLNLISFQFSVGSRGCIGKSLALIMAKIVMIKVMKRYGRLIEEGIMNNKTREYGSGLTYFVENTSVKVSKIN